MRTLSLTLLLLSTIAMGNLFHCPALAKKPLKPTNKTAHYKHKNDLISTDIEIDAPVEVVWKMVHTEREKAPNLVYSKLQKEDRNFQVFEQKWTIVPFVKTTTCVIEEQEIPNKRIDYRVVNSNQFKVMEGSWIFSPGVDGKSTKLALTTYMELRGFAPITVVKLMAKKKMEQRLAHIKELAEKPHADLDVGGRVVN